jgi:Cu/Ag efflux pump CusA
MSLGGLALAVGILVDSSTVTMENTHAHLVMSKPLARTVADCGREVAGPLLIAMLCVLCVFVPSFFMQGAARALFLPLTLAAGFAMIASWLLDRTLVPILSVWWLRPTDAQQKPGAIERIECGYQALRQRVATRRAGFVIAIYLVATVLVISHCWPRERPWR